MGMPFRVVLYAENPAKANAGARAAFARIQQLNDILSDYDASSELSRLSRTSGSGQAVRVSDDLWRVLARALEISRRSEGAFDVTVGPVINLWRRARRQQALPDPARLAAARRAVGWQHVRLDAAARTVELRLPDMRLDLGGIAKGYALAEALKVLEGRRLPRALVSCGGDMAAGEPPPGQAGWRIEVAPPKLTDAPPSRFVRLRGAALATSGDLFQYVEIEGVRYSHIVDPRTGLGLTDHSQVVVIAADAMTADALATAVSVLGPAKGLRLVRKERGAAALIMRQPAGRFEATESPRFRRFLETP